MESQVTRRHRFMADQEPSSSARDSHPEISAGVWPADFSPKIVRFDELARCGEEIWIEHNRQLYRLRSTRQGKLILTK